MSYWLLHPHRLPTRQPTQPTVSLFLFALGATFSKPTFFRQMSETILGDCRWTAFVLRVFLISLLASKSTSPKIKVQAEVQSLAMVGDA